MLLLMIIDTLYIFQILLEVKQMKDHKIKMNDLEEMLFYAVRTDDACTVQRALKEGADVDTIYFADCEVTKTYWSALHLSCEKGHYDVAKTLLEAGADPNITDKWLQTPLMYSTTIEWTNVMKLLVEKGCDINYQDNYGYTALHRSVNCSDTECLELLIKSGADINIRNSTGRTAFWCTMQEDGHLAHAKCLLDAGCDINILDGKTGFTPLHVSKVFMMH